MSSKFRAFLSDQINWRFQVVLQGMTSRYGVLGARFYKQFLPTSKMDGRGHPPREINQRQYDLALRLYNQRAKNQANGG